MRADASPTIGAGHVARCLTVAEGLRGRGATVRFLGREMPRHLQDWIRSEGHEFADLGGDDGTQDAEVVNVSWLRTSQAEDARAVLAALQGEHWDWIVVDHYGIDATWELAVRSPRTQLLAIDDLADRPHACDALLDQNLPAAGERYRGLVPSACMTMLGPTYALVRDEFRTARAASGPRDGHIERVLIFIGGGDADNYTGRAVDACVAAGFGWGQADVVIAPTHPARTAIEAECARNGYRLHVQTREMAALMAAADFAIGATGSASWERCAVGLPTLAFSTARNQDRILAGLEERGAVMTLAPAEAVTSQALAAGLDAARRSPARVRAVSEAAWACVDGLGVSRVCDLLEVAHQA